MTRRLTIYIAPRFEGAIVKVEVYVAQIHDRGYFIPALNIIVLSSDAYDAFRQMDQAARTRMCQKLEVLQQPELPATFEQT
jgi:hypothetical protein